MHGELCVNVVTGAVLVADICGRGVSAIVNTGSQSTIIPRLLLHKVFCHLKKAGRVTQTGVPMYKVQRERGTSHQCNCSSSVYSSCGWSIHHGASFCSA